MKYNNLRKDIINYIEGSMLDYDCHAKDFENMSEEELLFLVDGTVDTKPVTGEHSYEIILISSFNDIKQYEHYAPMWCIFQSEEVFFEESHRGECHFVLCKRDDADNYDRIAFGENYPYDNYGLSFIALLLTKENRLVSVTSRRNWDEDYDHYLSFEQLKNVLGKDLFNATINTNPLRILQISDTHCRHRQLINLPAADVIVHCGDFSEMGTEDEILDFLKFLFRQRQILQTGDQTVHPVIHKMLQYCAVGFRPGADDDGQIAFRQQCLLDAEGDVGKERIAQPPEQDSNTAGFSVERSLSDQIGAECLLIGPIQTEKF